MTYTPKYGSATPDPGDEDPTPAEGAVTGAAPGARPGAAGFWTRSRVALVAVLAIALGLGTWLLWPKPPKVEVAPPVAPTTSVPRTSTAVTSNAPSPAAPSTSVAPVAPPPATTTKAPGSLDCQPMGEGFVPSRYILSRPKVDARVLSLGEASDGSIAAPPKNQRRTAAWWNNGPRPGSTEGKVVLSIHTYRNGGAVGNELFEGGKSQVQPGDTIKLIGKDGQVACYEFVEARKVMVSDYDPNSDVMVDFNGDPLLTIVICWDFERDTEFWASRVFFYFKPVA